MTAHKLYQRYFVIKEERIIRVLKKYGCKHPVALQILEDMIKDEDTGLERKEFHK